MGILRELQDYLEVLARIEGVFLIYLGVMEGILGIMVFSVEYLLLLLLTRSPSPPTRVTSPPPESPAIETLAKGIQQLQELQAKALSKEPTASASEIVKPGLTSLTPLPDVKTGSESALLFQDWLEIAGSSLADISEQSGEWWRSVVQLVEKTYNKWLTSTPLERLAISPASSEELISGRWTRLNARVTSLLLGAMTEDLKSEMVTQRISQDSVRIVFRLFTWYQPGGTAERSEVLRRLQSPADYAPVSTVEESLKAIRNWPRWLARCQAVKMTPPDPSVLAKGLMALTQHHIEKSGDSLFRTSMLRTTLRLDAQPGMEQILAYQKHLQAELETMSASSATPTATSASTQGAATNPKIRALEKGGGPKGGAREPVEKDKPIDLCRYFMKAGGCKRGARCTYSHSMQSLDKDLRSRKCLSCGSESHRQKDCPVGKGAQRQKGSPGSPATERKGGDTRPSGASSTAATVASVQDPVPGIPWTLETLVQAAQQVIQGQPSSQEGESSPEKTKSGAGPEMRTLVVKDIRICSVQATSAALLDSGATHCLRNATSVEEWRDAEKVMVELAGNHMLQMRMTSGGTLLMPYKQLHGDSSSRSAQTIVPLGQLVQTLGYSLIWTPTTCFLQDSEGEKIPLKVSSGCPQLQEVEALALIARIEERKRERLVNESLTLGDRLNIASMEMNKTWEDHLRQYAIKGDTGDGLRALRDAPFLEDLPSQWRIRGL
eukprot:s163_g12.t1